MRIIVLACCLWLCSANAAHAAAGRRAATIFAEAAPDQETLHEMLAAAPEGDAEDQAEAETERVARIAALAKDVEESKSDLVRANGLFELAKLHQERAFYLRDQALSQYQADYDRWWIGESLAEPELKLDAWREEMLVRVGVLRELNANFHKDPRIAEINWQLASAMARLGNDHCEQYFKLAAQLARAPEWAVKTKLSRADWLVHSGKLDEAIALYSEAREKADESLKAYATYRLGWAYLSKAEAARGADRDALANKGEAALKLAVLGLKEDQPTRFRLKTEAARDLAWLWAARDDEKDAVAFFAKHKLDAALAEFRERQAEEWLSKGRLDKAVAYYQGLIQADPENPRRPDIHLKLAHAYIVAGHVTGLEQEVSSLARITGNASDPWFDEHEDDAALMTRARKMSQYLPLQAGFKIYRTAMQERDPKRRKDMLAAAVKELKGQIGSAKSGEQALTIRVTLVQAMLGLERYAEALTELDEIVKLGAKAEPHLAGAALERLNVIVKLDSMQNYPPLPAPGEVRSPIPLPEMKRRFAAAAADYLTIVPDAENIVGLRYQIAQDLFSYGHYDEALPLLEAIVTEYPRTEEAKAGIEICLSMNLKRKKWDELIRLSTTFLNNRDVRGKQLRDYIKENLDWAKAQTGGGKTVH